jgi:hypothetical protein
MDTEYKTKAIQGLEPIAPALGGLAPLTVLRASPSFAVMRAQDSVPATSRRIVAEWSLSGATDWQQPDGTEDPASADQDYPLNTWRSLAPRLSHVTPGCELRAFAIYCPAGLVHKLQDPGPPEVWVSDGAWAEVRVGVTWTNSASSSGPLYRSASMEGSGSGTYTGEEANGAGQNWTLTRAVDIGRFSPSGFVSTPATAALYSEWSDVEITLEIRGGARVQQVVVYEYPLSHVTDNDNDGLVSVHAMPPSLSPQTPGPLTRAPDGATYEEHRFGTRRTMQVAERQSERLGPRILHWSAWDESETDLWQQAEATPIAITQTTFRHLLDSTITGYAATTPGWIVGAAYAKLRRLSGEMLIGRNEIAAAPVRVRVDAERAVGTGVIRVRCGQYDWVDVTVTGGRAIYEATGYIESQIYADDPAWPLVLFGRVLAGGSTLSVYGVDIDYGTW